VIDITGCGASRAAVGSILLAGGAAVARASEIYAAGVWSGKRSITKAKHPAKIGAAQLVPLVKVPAATMFLPGAPMALVPVALGE
jgi:hypothetical protein